MKYRPEPPKPPDPELLALEGILDALRDQNSLLRLIAAEQIASKQLLQQVVDNTNHQRNITSGIIKETTMLPIAPGNSPQFQVTVTPAGATVVAASSVYSINPNTSGSTATQNASDPTGLTVTVDIPSGATVPFSDVLVWTYTNADGTIATASFPLTDSTQPVTDVTGGTIAQIL